MEKNKVNQVYFEFKDFLATANSYITVTEWHNGEGHDIEIKSPEEVQRFSLTFTEWHALQHAMSGINL